MIVDDDNESRALLGEFLVDEGYTVETAPDGATALGKLAQFPADVLLTDLEMPGMSGLDLIRRFHALDPDRPTLLMTAHRDAVAFGSLGDDGHSVAFLQKPIDLDDLTAMLRRLVEETPPLAATDGWIAAH